MDIFPTSEMASAAKMSEALTMESFAKGGRFSAGQPMIVGEMGPELIFPDSGGMVTSAQRTSAMQQQALNRQMLGGMGGGGTNIVNAPSVVNAPQSSMTMVGTPIVNDNPVVREINAAR